MEAVSGRAQKFPTGHLWSQPEVLPEAERLGLNAQERWDGKAVPRCA